MTGHATIEALSRELLARHRADLGMTFRFDCCSFRVLSNSHELLDCLTEYFRPFLAHLETADIEVTALEGVPPALPFKMVVKQPDPGKARIKEEFADLSDGRVIRKKLTGLLFFLGNGINLAIGETVRNYNQVVNFINNRYIEWLVRDGCLLGHAAGVSTGSRGVALAGFSGMGKSTLALHLMSRDLKFVSNDRLLVRQENGALTMLGIPKQPRVNPGTMLNNPDLEGILPPQKRSELGRMSVEELWQLEQKYDVLIDDVYGEDRFALRSPMTALFILNWHRDSGPTRVKPVDLTLRRDLLKAFRKDLGLFVDPQPNKDRAEQPEDLYLDHLSHCDVYEISGSIDFDGATRSILETLHAG